MAKKRKFTWEAWDFDCDGEAYIIAKDECPDRAKVMAYIDEVDTVDVSTAPEEAVHEGWCAYQCRSDWENTDDQCGGYQVYEMGKRPANRKTGKPKPGWFPVWIVRKGEWY
jgi:hypothetical protein